MMSDNKNTTPPQGSQENIELQQNDAITGQNKPITVSDKSAIPLNSTADNNKTGVPHNNKQSQPPHPAPKTKHSPLALLIALIALGAGGYALYQNRYEKPAVQSQDISMLRNQIDQIRQALSSKADGSQLDTIKNNIDSLSKKINEQNKQITQIRQQPDTPDEAQINALIDRQVAEQVRIQVGKARQTLEQTLAAQQSISTAQGNAPDKEQINTLVKEALANADAARDGNRPIVDFSSEIAAIKQDKADIQQEKAAIQQDKSDIQRYINTIKQQGETIHASIGSALRDAEQKINAAGQRPIVAPLLNTLSLAEIAADAQQYSTAAQYLNLAHDNFAALHLDQAPYARYGEQIATFAQQMQQIAETRNSQTKIDDIIAGIDGWPFIKTDARNLLDKDDDAKPTESWKSDLKRIGGNILSKTITVTKNDEAGLTWINQNPYLQQVIRENMRLDLGMIRNALLLGDIPRAQSVLKTVQEQSARYFNTGSDTVKNALTTLQTLTTPDSDAPDIAALIASIKNAG